MPNAISFERSGETKAVKFYHTAVLEGKFISDEKRHLCFI